MVFTMLYQPRPWCSPRLNSHERWIYHKKAIVFIMSHYWRPKCSPCLTRWRRTLPMSFLTAPASTAFPLSLTISTGLPFLWWSKTIGLNRVNITHLVESRITSEPSTLRAITADTMADVLEGRYNHKLRNVRIIDCRLEQLHIFTGPRPDYCHWRKCHPLSTHW